MDVAIQAGGGWFSQKLSDIGLGFGFDARARRDDDADDDDSDDDKAAAKTPVKSPPKLPPRATAKQQTPSGVASPCTWTA